MAIYHRDAFACVYCGAGKRLTIDHVSPVVVQGRTAADPANLVTACLSCNSAKAGRPYRAWLAMLREQGRDTGEIAKRVRRQRRARVNRAVGRFLAWGRGR